MTAHEITLDQVRQETLPESGQYFRASDFLSDQEKDELSAANATGKEPEKPYDNIDAYEAEMLARFGWQTFQAWQSGEIDEEQMAKFMLAERDRERRTIQPILAMILGANAGANNGDKNGHAPKSLRFAQELLKKYTD